VKHLKVEYKTDAGNSIVLFDGEVNEVVWSDGPGGIRVEGKNGTGGGGMGGLLDLLTGGSKARTEAVVEEKRASLNEPEPVVLAAEVVGADDSIEVIRAAQA
jgi:hypothetical protein